MTLDDGQGAPAMSDDEFWLIVGSLDWDNAVDDDAVLGPAKEALAALREEAIEGFDDVLAEKLHALDTREHARRAYEGETDPDDGDQYVSADDFLYRRCAVVANGRPFYEEVLRDPRRMPTDQSFEAILYLAATAYEEKTGADYTHVPAVSFESFTNEAGWAPTERTKGGFYTDARIPPGNRRPT